MATDVRRSLLTEAPAQRVSRPNARAPQIARNTTKPNSSPAPADAEQKIRVLVAAENRLLREALARMLAKHSGIEVVGLNSATSAEAEAAHQGQSHVLLLSSRGSIDQDLAAVHQARTCFPDARILLMKIGRAHV